MDNNYIVDLELSKELKEANWKKATTYHYCNENIYIFEKDGCKQCEHNFYKSMMQIDSMKFGINCEEYIPAPNIAEILEDFTNIEIIKDDRGYSVKAFPFNSVVNESLVDALAELWIYFKKERLI